MVYYLLLLVKYASYLIAAVLALLLLASLLKSRRLLNVSNIMEGMKGSLKSKIGIFVRAVGWFAAIALIAVMLADMESTLHGRATISLNYTNASKGLNPDGSRYNMSEILSDEVLEHAILTGAFEKVTIDDLKKSLSLIPTVQGATNDEYNYRISTEFNLSYYAAGNTADLNASTVLQVVMQAYRDWYYENYVDRFRLLSLDYNDMDHFDYLEICDYLDKKAQNISFYLSAYEQKDANFRKEGNENTFSRLSTSCWQFRDVALENLRSYILENGLSKDRESYIGKLDYESWVAQSDYSKAFQSHFIRLEAIKMYENDMARIVLVPSYDPSDEFYMSRTKIGIDTFSREAESFSNEMTELDYLVSENNLISKKLSSSKAKEYHYTQVDRMIEDLKEQLTELSNSVKQLTEASQSKELNQGFTLNLEPTHVGFWTNVVKICMFGMYLYVTIGLIKLLGRLFKKVGREKKEEAF